MACRPPRGAWRRIPADNKHVRFDKKGGKGLSIRAMPKKPGGEADKILPHRATLGFNHTLDVEVSDTMDGVKQKIRGSLALDNQTPFPVVSYFYGDTEKQSAVLITDSSTDVTEYTKPKKHPSDGAQSSADLDAGQVLDGVEGVLPAEGGDLDRHRPVVRSNSSKTASV